MNPSVAADIELLANFIYDNGAKSVFIDQQEHEASDRVLAWLSAHSNDGSAAQI